MLDVSGLVVTFDGFRALDGLDFHVDSGELRFVIGPNGAGKTTLIDCVTGRVRASAGSVTFDGTELTRRKEHEIARLGVGRTFQTPAVFDALTVRENVNLAIRRRHRLAGLLRPTPAVEREVENTTLIEVGLHPRAATPAGILSHGERKWLEVAMLVAQEADLLLLDEPVAGMTRDERERTGELLRKLSSGRTIVVVEHDMEFLRTFAQTVTVLDEGRMIAEGPVAQVQSDPEVVRVYLGRSHREDEPVEVP